MDDLSAWLLGWVCLKVAYRNFDGLYPASGKILYLRSSYFGGLSQETLPAWCLPHFWTLDKPTDHTGGGRNPAAPWLKPYKY